QLAVGSGWRGRARALIERRARAERRRSSSRPFAAEPPHCRLRREHAELKGRLAVALRVLGTLTERVDGDGIAEDRGAAALARRAERVLEQPAEDTEATIGGVHDGGTRLGGGDAGEGHQCVVADHPPLVEGDGWHERD